MFSPLWNRRGVSGGMGAKMGRGDCRQKVGMAGVVLVQCSLPLQVLGRI